ncbi:MAG: hypothetical protein A2806_02525 [Candidatus Terrybacteria bacterium RIFCSPHIGHO2_01_FULL_48_17]|uniref:Cohesin domain-containing protein n=1 Tax=Candidatus Terrybacteria bacterium RIFCSPHIGHO2_01_FULL_48_17 TaxID=1802362 RepID=A0A1G2PHS8_9BACT|nr:MAG: hypothetical protein A2806_02525 [Candidatus Terrybacteria bacterium RIFCSPHIGHO2_01_FULL_48_17]
MRKFITFFIFGFLFFLSIQKAEAAQLLLYPDPLEIPVGETGLLELRLDTEQEDVNAAEIVLNFPPGALVARDILLGGSVLPLIPETPFIGIDSLKIVAGAPAGFNGSGTIARIVFSAKEGISADSAAISFDDRTRIFLNDGKATPTLVTARPARAVFLSASSIDLISTTHTDQTQWHNRDTAVMKWEAREGAAYSYEVSRDPYAVPDGTSDNPVGDIQVGPLEDGIYYFSLCELAVYEGGFACRRNAQQQPDVARFRLMIDLTSPESFEVFVAKTKDVFEGDYWYAVFAPRDAMSGILKVEVAEAKGNEDPLWAEAASPYALRDQNRVSTLLVRATDLAGNIQEASVSPQPQVFPWYVPVAAAAVLLMLILLVQKMRSRGKTMHGIIHTMDEQTA